MKPQDEIVFQERLGEICKSQDFIPDVKVDIHENFNEISRLLPVTRKKPDEPFYSDVIAQLLGKGGAIKENKQLLLLFVGYLINVAKISKREQVQKVLNDIQSDIEGDVFVDVERGRIDVLIWKEGKWAVVIENKLRGETDQIRQIPRYIEYVKKELGVKECVVVYLKAFEKDARPAGLGYSDKSNDWEIVNRALLPVAAYLPNDTIGQSLINGWLTYCKRNASEPTTKVVSLFSSMLEKLSESAHNLSLVTRVYDAMRKAGADLTDLHNEGECVNSLLRSVGVDVLQQVARRCQSFGFTPGQLHLKKDKLETCFFLPIFGKKYLIVLDVQMDRLSFNVRKGWRTSVDSADDVVKNIFGEDGFTIKGHRYIVSHFDNASVDGMISSTERVLKLISDNIKNFESALQYGDCATGVCAGKEKVSADNDKRMQGQTATKSSHEMKRTKVKAAKYFHCQEETGKKTEDRRMDAALEGIFKYRDECVPTANINEYLRNLPQDVAKEVPAWATRRFVSKCNRAGFTKLYAYGDKAVFEFLDLQLDDPEKSTLALKIDVDFDLILKARSQGVKLYAEGKGCTGVFAGKSGLGKRKKALAAIRDIVSECDNGCSLRHGKSNQNDWIAFDAIIDVERGIVTGVDGLIAYVSRLVQNLEQRQSRLCEAIKGMGK